jgi:hypothetical protein
LRVLQTLWMVKVVLTRNSGDAITSVVRRTRSFG